MNATLETPTSAPALAELPQEKELISAGLDYYKPTMSQHAFEVAPDAEVTFTLKNRGEQRLMDYIDPTELQGRFDYLRKTGWHEVELTYLSGLQHPNGESVFSKQFVDYLRKQPLPPVAVEYDQETNDIGVAVTGPWALSTFWETIVMSEINEMYFENYMIAHEINPFDVYDEGNRRLSEKSAILQANPDIKFIDFGTRRHFSQRWQRHVLERLMIECSDNLVGTSNVALAQKYGIKPIGTFAHEMPMVYAAMAQAKGEDVRASHNQFLQDWYARYGEPLSIALTDTFTTDFFFSDFTREQALAWRGVRHDSDDPVAFGETLLAFYEKNGVDPKTKTIVFSDGLDIGQIVSLYKHFEGRINILFGWGTTLTNDMGIKPLNIVMKATHVRLPLADVEADTVKLSNNAGKHTGPAELIEEYRDKYFRVA